MYKRIECIHVVGYMHNCRCIKDIVGGEHTLILRICIRVLSECISDSVLVDTAEKRMHDDDSILLRASRLLAPTLFGVCETSLFSQKTENKMRKKKTTRMILL